MHGFNKYIAYKNDNFTHYKTMVLNLSQFVLKTNGKSSAEILQYAPSSYTVYYEYNNNIKYNGLISSPLSPPVLKCSSLSVHSTAVVLTKYEIRLAYGSNTVILVALTQSLQHGQRT